MQAWLSAVPAAMVYLAVFLVVGGEFLCLPLPGGVVLTTATLLAVQGSVEPWAVCAAATAGVLAGSAAGYRVGRRGGRAVLEKLVRRFPRMLSQARVANTEKLFERWGVRMIVVSCFSAVLRMITAPLSGTVAVPVRRFAPGITVSVLLWSIGTTLGIYYLGLAAESWIDGLSWAGLAMLAALALASVPSWFRHRTGTR
ncbi:VTT domain-containing protein [Amycolatopsis sp. NPDC048633]|uniref:DedA family protein n=1 Tax=Amycolatopsis sp. NPDC048633 TaxID=3157095 RepID=UPI0033FB276E